MFFLRMSAYASTSATKRSSEQCKRTPRPTKNEVQCNPAPTRGLRKVVSHTFSGQRNSGPTKGGLAHLFGALHTWGHREVVSHTCPGLLYTGGHREVVSHTCPGLIYRQGGRREVVSHTCPGLIYRQGAAERWSHTPAQG